MPFARNIGAGASRHCSPTNRPVEAAFDNGCKLRLVPSNWKIQWGGRVFLLGENRVSAQAGKGD
jgi:hypothetical protein